MKSNLFLLPNLITISRLLCIPLILVFYLSGIDSLKLKPITNLKNAIRKENTISKLGKEIIVTLDFNS